MAKKAADNGGKRKLVDRLRNRYKLVVLNIDTFEERFSLLLTPWNVIVHNDPVTLMSSTAVKLGGTNTNPTEDLTARIEAAIDQADDDADEVGNLCDNCVATANQNQANRQIGSIGGIN